MHVVGQRVHVCGSAASTPGESTRRRRLASTHAVVYAARLPARMQLACSPALACHPSSRAPGLRRLACLPARRLPSRAPVHDGIGSSPPRPHAGGPPAHEHLSASSTRPRPARSPAVHAARMLTCSSAPTRSPPSRTPTWNACGGSPATHAVCPPAHERPPASITGRQPGERELCGGVGTVAMARRELRVRRGAGDDSRAVCASSFPRFSGQDEVDALMR